MVDLPAPCAAWGCLWDAVSGRRGQGGLLLGLRRQVVAVAGGGGGGSLLPCLCTLAVQAASPEMQQFLVQQQAQAQLQQTISRLTDECWSKCMGTPGARSGVRSPARAGGAGRGSSCGVAAASRHCEPASWAAEQRRL